MVLCGAITIYKYTQNLADIIIPYSNDTLFFLHNISIIKYIIFIHWNLYNMVLCGAITIYKYTQNNYYVKNNCIFILSTYNALYRTY